MSARSGATGLRRRTNSTASRPWVCYRSDNHRSAAKVRGLCAFPIFPALVAPAALRRGSPGSLPPPRRGSKVAIGGRPAQPRSRCHYWIEFALSPATGANPGKSDFDPVVTYDRGRWGGPNAAAGGNGGCPGALECFEFPMISLASFFPKKTARQQSPTASFLAGFLVLAHFYFEILRNRGHCVTVPL